MGIIARRLFGITLRMGHLIKDGAWQAENYIVFAKDGRSQNIRGKGLPNVCVNGMRLWCDNNGINWQEFRKKGITAQQVVDTGDARAIMALLKHHRGRTK